MKSDYEILLFYKYINIEDPEELMQTQREMCTRLGLKCRTIIAHEGINGTLEGLKENTQKYIDEMSKDERFADVHWKRSVGTETGDAFPRINIKVRDEIVSLHVDGQEDVGPLNKLEDGRPATAEYITADELHDLLESDEEFYIIDMRNDYEHKIGYFENSVLPPMKNFRELPDLVEYLNDFKHKQVVTVCTGGIRCEKASGFLLKLGFTNVRQLYGGIVTYMEKYPNEHFKGKLYVFDGRTKMGFKIDDEKHEVVGHCDRCGKISDNYVDCAYIYCQGHRHILCCEDCMHKSGIAFCSDLCEEKYFELGVEK
ncbi:rhodanese-related sulfurtransferase [Candidatus Dojkabacteria bacterium]|uniref:tRNA uridine(34) hydroxylase n=1 Tax=Candidatus Dojkabacteria bacterium TaxID=2099670 RepID=A0A955L1Q2_9BACT|nr:rhodanese-related sulfurtransferase [Candidatus Dojkabacteria bacterium]